MTRMQIKSKIQELSKDQKTACLALQCEREIKFLESERMTCIKEHKEKLEQIDERINSRKEWLIQL